MHKYSAINICARLERGTRSLFISEPCLNSLHQSNKLLHALNLNSLYLMLVLTK